MNDNESILAELRRIGAWADMQRRITKWSLIAVAVLVPALIVFGIVMENRFSASMEEAHSPEKAAKPSWNDVDWNIRRADPDEAIRIGEGLIQKMPQYPEGHLRLASAYLAAGRAEKAREHYAEAFRLLPTEENGKLLAAIDRRIKEGNPQPDGAAPRSQPLRLETNQTPPAAASRR
jgi:cytochrome c-type biogenesis protein CcmH/NrfG